MDNNIAKGNVNDVGMPLSTSGGTVTGDWNRDRSWWQDNYHTRPYATADRGFDDYEPAYRFGYGSASRYHGKSWNEVEPHLRSDWDRFEGRGQSTWENMKDAVRDAWDNITGKR
ncbi:MAG TPA: hypothetical protein VHM24_02575 [Gemmatimonadaceae bacterium]|nr:hypothetical protein [Gemmatimonadaceae bacterium]